MLKMQPGGCFMGQLDNRNKLFLQTVKLALFAFLSVFSIKSYALDLGMPIACDYGKNCYISNYFDHEAEDKIYKDYTCGNISEDGYKHTDFILKNYSQMKEGVNVLAGDSGVVKYVRNDISDVNVELSGIESVKGHECGNGVLIEHKRGYETQYCHLKKGSVLVKKGDKVEKGQNIAQVGLSGLTSFPYLEFTVSMNGKELDPFTGEDPISGKAEVACDSLDIYPLWDKSTEKTLAYIQTALLSSGFSSKVPNMLGAREGRYKATKIRRDSILLSLWVDILGVRSGDSLRMTIFGPNGQEIYSNTKSFNADKRHLFQFIGTKLEGDKKHWDEGEYIGKIELIRQTNGKDAVIINQTNTIEIVPEDMLQ